MMYNRAKSASLRRAAFAERIGHGTGHVLAEDHMDHILVHFRFASLLPPVDEMAVEIAGD